MSGYEKLKKAVLEDIKKENGKFNENDCFREYCDKFQWVIDRAKHYEAKLQIPWADILTVW